MIDRPRDPKLNGVSIEDMKRALRWEHCRQEAAITRLSSSCLGSIVGRHVVGMDAYRLARDAAWRFWPKYERINRDFLPDDPVYSVARTGYTTVATTDIITYQTPASRKWRVLEVILGSEATASAAHRIVWQVSTGGTTETAGNVPEKFDIDSPSSMFGTADIVFNWTTQPTLSAQPKLTWAYNELGGYFDWKAAPGAEVQHRNSEQASYRSTTGTGVISTVVIHEEM